MIVAGIAAGISPSPSASREAAVSGHWHFDANSIFEFVSTQSRIGLTAEFDVTDYGKDYSSFAAIPTPTPRLHILFSQAATNLDRECSSSDKCLALEGRRSSVLHAAWECVGYMT